MADRKVARLSKKSDEGKSGSRRAAATAHTYAQASHQWGESAKEGSRQAARSAEHAGAVASDALERSARFGEQAARETTQNIEAAMKYSSVLANGVQTFWQEWMGCAQEAMQKNVDGLQNLLRCRSASDLFQAHSELIKEEMQVLMDGGSRLSELSVRIANDAAKAFGDRFGGDGTGKPTTRA